MLNTGLLLDALRDLGDVTDHGYVFVRDGDRELRIPHAEVVRRARARGRHLCSLGARRGDRVAIIVPDADEFVLTFLGAITAGLLPVPMYPPVGLRSYEQYIATAGAILRRAEAGVLVTTHQTQAVAAAVAPQAPSLRHLVTVSEFREDLPEDGRWIEVQPDDPCFLQFTSGSTGEPRGVVVSHGNVAANVRGYMGHALRMEDPEVDRGVSWLPLYHDMGLIGSVIGPLFGRGTMVFLPTLRFVRSPRVWMEAVSRYGATGTCGPNFAFALALKSAAPDWVRTLDLSRLRVLGCGAEPINPTVLHAFAEAFAPAGLRPEAITPCYGMAEATVAISFARADAPVRVARIRRGAAERDGVVTLANGAATDDVQEIVACGRTFPEHEVGIAGRDGELLPDGHVGEIVFRGPSVAHGYYNDPEATAAVFRAGWLHTGDLGFVLEGDLYVCGRIKDLVIRNGRNIAPQAIEWAVEGLPGTRPGCAVAFGAPGEAGERVVVVIETREPGDHLVRAARERVREALGIVADEILLVPPRTLPRTSSGKVQRRRLRQRYLSGHELVPAALANATRPSLAAADGGQAPPAGL